MKIRFALVGTGWRAGFFARMVEAGIRPEKQGKRAEDLSGAKAGNSTFGYKKQGGCGMNCSPFRFDDLKLSETESCMAEPAADVRFRIRRGKESRFAQATSCMQISTARATSAAIRPSSSAA